MKLTRDNGARLAWGIVVVAALTRALATFTPVPFYFESDPLVDLPLLTGFEPASLVALDLFVIALSALALVLDARRGISAPAIALWTCGMASVLWHAWAGEGDRSSHARIGIGWASALAAGLAGAHACRDERTRRFTISALLGVAAMLASKGLLQVLVEHPASVESYRLNRDAILRSHGWAAGSPNALMFERRMLQREATGWFGMSNVYATFAAGLGTACVGLLAATWWCGLGARRVSIGVGIGAAAGVAGVVMSHSKGGYAALLLGVVIFGATAAWMVKRGSLPRRIGTAALAAIALPLMAVSLRGVVGERIGELSLWFRAFYARAALRIFAENPLAGVGPGGFKGAYMRAKPPLSPEEVDSPHSVLLDFASTLGVFGVAWCALVVAAVLCCGRAFTREAPTGRPGVAMTRQRAAAISLVAVAPTAISAWFERDSTPIESAASRIAGLMGWIGVSIAVDATLGALAGARRGRAVGASLAHAAIIAGALAMAAHSQIELTPTHATASTLLMILIGAAAAPGMRIGTARAWRAWAAAGVFGLAIAAALPLAIGLTRQRHWLTAAAARLAPGASINARLSELARTSDGAEMARIVNELRALLGPGTPAQASPSALLRLLMIQSASASVCFEKAADLAPASPALQNLAIHFWLSEYGVARTLHQDFPSDEHDGLALVALDRAVALARNGADRWPDRAGSWSRLASVLELRSQHPTPTNNESDDLESAIQALETAASLDPYGNWLPSRLATLCSRIGDHDRAARWASKALELDENLRLDPVRRFGSQERAELDAIAAGSKAPK